MPEKTKRYRGDNPYKIDTVGLDMPEQLQDFKLSHNHGWYPLEQGENQASRDSVDVVEWSGVDHNPCLILGILCRGKHVHHCDKGSVGNLTWSTSNYDPTSG